MGKTVKLTALFPVLAVMLSGCMGDGLRPHQGEDSIIAMPMDRGFDKGALEDGIGAIVYDPDGCQGWIIDDGLEGYSGRRFDPVSGLPICNNAYPPGTVVGQYRSDTEGIPDFVPGVMSGQ